MDISKTYISQPVALVSYEGLTTVNVSTVSGYTSAGKYLTYVVSFIIEPFGCLVRLKDVRVVGLDGSIAVFTATPAGDSVGECLAYIVSKL